MIDSGLLLLGHPVFSNVDMPEASGVFFIRYQQMCIVYVCV